MVSRFESWFSGNSVGSESDEPSSESIGSVSEETPSNTSSQTVRQTDPRERDDGISRQSADNIRLVITRTARRLRQEAGSTLTPTALATLASIERNSPITPTRLAQIERVKRPTVTRVISHLTDLGMIDRIPDPEDGRSCRLEITETGTAYLGEQRSKKSAYLTHLLESLPADDIETLEKAASILESALERGLEDRSR